MSRLRPLHVLWLTLAAGCGDDKVSSASALREALAGAEPGDVVHVEAGRYEGSFVVPAGVTLEGSGKGATVLVVAGEDPALVLQPGTPGSAATDLTIESSGPSGAAVLAHGAGDAALRRVNVEASVGVAVAAEDLDRLILDEVTLSGPVDAANVGEFTSAGVLDSGYAGLATSRVAAVEITALDVRGFAQFGAVFAHSGVSWTGGTACGTLGVGIMFAGGSGTLDGVTICDVFAGLRIYWASGLVIAAGADVTTTDVTITRVEGVGVLQDGSTSGHLDVDVADNGFAGIWLQNGAGTLAAPALRVSGAATTISANGGGGVIAVASTGIDLQDALIEQTTLLGKIVGETTLVMVGDGVQLVGSVTDVLLRSLTISDNGRIGILVDGAGMSLAGVVMQDVVVSGGGEELGLLGQNGSIAPDWSAGVTVTGAAAANDAAFSGTLDILVPAQANQLPSAGPVGDYGLLGQNGLLVGLLGQNG